MRYAIAVLLVVVVSGCRLEPVEMEHNAKREADECIKGHLGAFSRSGLSSDAFLYKTVAETCKQIWIGVQPSTAPIIVQRWMP